MSHKKIKEKSRKKNRRRDKSSIDSGSCEDGSDCSHDSGSEWVDDGSSFKTVSEESVVESNNETAAIDPNEKSMSQLPLTIG
jgi:hypothetical protein